MTHTERRIYRVRVRYPFDVTYSIPTVCPELAYDIVQDYAHPDLVEIPGIHCQGERDLVDGEIIDIVTNDGTICFQAPEWLTRRGWP